jgi:hypothetical protein
LGRLLQLHDEADFFAVFPELRQMAVQSENILPFLLAIRATDAGDDFRISFGLRLLYTLFADEVTASSIKEKYNFSYLDLIALSGQVDPFEGTGALKMKQEVDRIKNTVSWQVTKPLRFFANLFKGSK